MRRTIALILLVVVSACGGDDDDDDASEDTVPPTEALSDTALISYHYQDASVPPDVQRNYLLEITHDNVHYVIDSYDDVVAEDTVPIPVDVWEGLTDTSAVAAAEIVAPEEGCTGGTARHLIITDGDEELLNGGFDVCGGANEASAEILDDYVAPVLAAIPDWETTVAP